MKSALVWSLYITSNWFNLYPHRPSTHFTLCNNNKCLSDTLTKPCTSTLQWQFCNFVLSVPTSECALVQSTWCLAILKCVIIWPLSKLWSVAWKVILPCKCGDNWMWRSEINGARVIQFVWVCMMNIVERFWNVWMKMRYFLNICWPLMTHWYMYECKLAV